MKSFSSACRMPAIMSICACSTHGCGGSGGRGASFTFPLADAHSYASPSINHNTACCQPKIHQCSHMVCARVSVLFASACVQRVCARADWARCPGRQRASHLQQRWAIYGVGGSTSGCQRCFGPWSVPQGEVSLALHQIDLDEQGLVIEPASKGNLGQIRHRACSWARGRWMVRGCCACW